MHSAADHIRSAILAAGGAISFEDFMSLALYGDHGFYTSAVPGRAGRRGDFLTSPEVGPLFGAVLARAIDDEWASLGRPRGFTVVDAGAGPGTLARAILAARPAFLEHGRYVAVEVSPTQRAMHPDGVESVADMPAVVDTGVIVANELLDNMPFELWVHDGRWRPAMVGSSADGFVEILGDAEPPPQLGGRAPHGARAPVQRRAARWLERALASLAEGRILVFDYCTPVTAELAMMPWRDWLRTYVCHERGVHYLRSPGEQDITAQVAIDQLAAVREPDAVRTQAQFLLRWGIDDLVAEGKRVWTESAAAPTLEAMKMRSRVSESEALLDPDGLGAFTAIEWVVRNP